MSAGDNHQKKEIDKVSGVETTGHEWDGLKELNNPLPRWWLWVFYACCLWSFWYFVIYPAWPTLGGATKGTGGYTQYGELKASQAEIMARQQEYLEKFEKATFDDITKDELLYSFAVEGGKAAFKDNCATCHGSGAEGRKGYPNLNDDDWLWGGKIEDIYTTLQYGIRAGNLDSRVSQMPAFGKDGLLKREEIDQVTEYVLALTKNTAVETMPGHQIFQQNCASCHGADGKGSRAVGAPNLADAIWLYGGTKKDIKESIYSARAGVMPAWKSRLDDNTIRQLAIYIHELGGGEAEEEQAEAPPALPVEVIEVKAEGAADER